MAETNLNRPEILDEMTETQLRELEFQFDEGDRDQFNELADVYGWSPETAQEVWAWLEAGQRLRQG